MRAFQLIGSVIDEGKVSRLMIADLEIQDSGCAVKTVWPASIDGIKAFLKKGRQNNITGVSLDGEKLSINIGLQRHFQFNKAGNLINNSGIVVILWTNGNGIFSILKSDFTSLMTTQDILFSSAMTNKIKIANADVDSDGNILSIEGQSGFAGHKRMVKMPKRVHTDMVYGERRINKDTGNSYIHPKQVLQINTGILEIEDGLKDVVMTGVLTKRTQGNKRIEKLIIPKSVRNIIFSGKFLRKDLTSKQLTIEFNRDTEVIDLVIDIESLLLNFAGKDGLITINVPSNVKRIDRLELINANLKSDGLNVIINFDSQSDIEHIYNCLGSTIIDTLTVNGLNRAAYIGRISDSFYSCKLTELDLSDIKVKSIRNSFNTDIVDRIIIGDQIEEIDGAFRKLKSKYDMLVGCIVLRHTTGVMKCMRNVCSAFEFNNYNYRLIEVEENFSVEHIDYSFNGFGLESAAVKQSILDGYNDKHLLTKDIDLQNVRVKQITNSFIGSRNKSIYYNIVMPKSVYMVKNSFTGWAIKSVRLPEYANILEGSCNSFLTDKNDEGREKRLTLPQGLEEVGGYIEIKTYKEILLPKTIKKILSYLNCQSMVVILEDGFDIYNVQIRSIGKIVRLPSFTTKLEPEMFKSANTALIDLRQTQITEIPEYCFNNTSGHVAMPEFSEEEREGLKKIAHNAFDNASMKLIVLPNTLETIEDYAFKNMQDVETIIIGDNITHFASNAFNGWRDKGIHNAKAYILKKSISYQELERARNNHNASVLDCAGIDWQVLDDWKDAPANVVLHVHSLKKRIDTLKNKQAMFSSDVPYKEEDEQQDTLLFVVEANLKQAYNWITELVSEGEKNTRYDSKMKLGESDTKLKLNTSGLFSTNIRPDGFMTKNIEIDCTFDINHLTHEFIGTINLLKEIFTACPKLALSETEQALSKLEKASVKIIYDDKINKIVLGEFSEKAKNKRSEMYVIYAISGNKIIYAGYSVNSRSNKQKLKLILLEIEAFSKLEHGADTIDAYLTRQNPVYRPVSHLLKVNDCLATARYNYRRGSRARLFGDLTSRKLATMALGSLVGESYIIDIKAYNELDVQEKIRIYGNISDNSYRITKGEYKVILYSVYKGTLIEAIADTGKDNLGMTIEEGMRPSNTIKYMHILDIEQFGDGGRLSKIVCSGIDNKPIEKEIAQLTETNDRLEKLKNSKNAYSNIERPCIEWQLAKLMVEEAKALNKSKFSADRLSEEYLVFLAECYMASKISAKEIYDKDIYIYDLDSTQLSNGKTLFKGQISYGQKRGTAFNLNRYIYCIIGFPPHQINQHIRNVESIILAFDDGDKLENIIHDSNIMYNTNATDIYLRNKPYKLDDFVIICNKRVSSYVGRYMSYNVQVAVSKRNGRVFITGSFGDINWRQDKENIELFTLFETKDILSAMVMVNKNDVDFIKKPSVSGIIEMEDSEIIGLMLEIKNMSEDNQDKEEEGQQYNSDNALIDMRNKILEGYPNGYILLSKYKENYKIMVKRPKNKWK